jgi:hypothetical protein
MTMSTKSFENPFYNDDLYMQSIITHDELMHNSISDHVNVKIDDDLLIQIPPRLKPIEGSPILDIEHNLDVLPDTTKLNTFSVLPDATKLDTFSVLPSEAELDTFSVLPSEAELDTFSVLPDATKLNTKCVLPSMTEQIVSMCKYNESNEYMNTLNKYFKSNSCQNIYSKEHNNKLLYVSLFFMIFFSISLITPFITVHHEKAGTIVSTLFRIIMWSIIIIYFTVPVIKCGRIICLGTDPDTGLSKFHIDKKKLTYFKVFNKWYNNTFWTKDIYNNLCIYDNTIFIVNGYNTTLEKLIKNM